MRPQWLGINIPISIALSDNEFQKAFRVASYPRSPVDEGGSIDHLFKAFWTVPEL